MIAVARVYVRVDGKPEQTLERPAATTVTIELPRRPADRSPDRRARRQGQPRRRARVRRRPDRDRRRGRRRPGSPQPSGRSRRRRRTRDRRTRARCISKWWLWGGVTVAFAGAGDLLRDRRAVGEVRSRRAQRGQPAAHVRRGQGPRVDRAPRRRCSPTSGSAPPAAFAVATVDPVPHRAARAGIRAAAHHTVTPTVAAGRWAALVLEVQF